MQCFIAVKQHSTATTNLYLQSSTYLCFIDMNFINKKYKHE